ATLYRAVYEAGPAGVSHQNLAQRGVDALNLSLARYARNPTLRFQPLAETQRALRGGLEYRLYRVLQRGLPFTAPNLEQCGLLEIRYLSLDEVCHAEDVWQNGHPALVTASPQTRMQVARVLLDYMRRELAIKVDVLSPLYQERIQRQSSQYLIDPWALDENEVTRMERAAILFPRPSRPGGYGGQVYLSAPGGFGQYPGPNLTVP